MKKLIMTLLCCVGLLVLFAAPAQATQEENRCGADLTWELFGSDLYIYGTGPMYDYSEENLPPWQDQFFNCVIALDPGITHIGERAFANSSVSEVYVPETLCSIGTDAFYNTPLLSWGREPVYIGNVLLGAPDGWWEYTLEIAEGTVGIADGAFKDCYDLAELIVPDSVYRIGKDAFAGTQWYEYQPDGIVYCGKVLYADKGGYSSWVYADEGTTGIADCAFQDSYNLQGISLPDSVLTIGDYAFAGCTGLYDVTGCYGVQSIGVSAFEGCSGLYAVNMTEALTEIGTAAFKDSSMQLGNFPWSLRTIGASAFENCAHITDVEARGDLVSIGDGAFKNCKNLSNVILGSAVTYIGDEAFADYFDRWWPFEEFRQPLIMQIDADRPYIGENAFANVAALGLYQPNAQGYTENSGWGGTIVWRENPITWAMPLTCGSTSSTVSWAILDEHILCVFGSGDMYPGNYTPAMDECPFEEYASMLTAVCVESGVTSLGDYAFTNLYNLESISFPADLEHLGKDSLKGTAWLNNQPDGLVCVGSVAYCFKGGVAGDVTIPEGVRVIGDKLFDGCTGLTSVTFPSTVHTIGVWAFRNCTSLTSLSIPQSVTTIKDSAFSGCTGLTSVTLPDSVTSIGNGAFAACTGLTDFDTGNGLTALNYSAFSSCTSLKNFRFGNNVSSIGRQAFHGCTSLTALTLPDSVKRIDENAFVDCTGLEYVDLNQVSTMSFAVFGGCTALKTVVFSPKLAQIPSTTFSRCTGLTAIVIPDTVQTLEANCFVGCSSLTDVYIGAGVRVVEAKPFENCTALTRFTVDPQNPWLDTDDQGVLFTENLTELIDYPAGRTGSYRMPEGVCSIREEAFTNCSALTGVTLPSTLQTINNYAFMNCTGLEQIIIPDNVTSIFSMVFYGCTGLRYAILGSGLKDVYYSLFENCTALKQVLIKEGPTRIQNNAFKGCDALTSVTIPDSVTEIQQYAFASCNNLKSVYLGAGVQELGYGAFSGSSKLANIHIPQSLTEVGTNAFNGTGLDREYLNGHISYAGTQAQWAAITVRSNNTDFQAPYILHYQADQSYLETGTHWGWVCTGCNGYACSQKVTEPAVTVCAGNQTLGSYTQLAWALKNCGNNAYLVLHEDMPVQLTLTRDLYIDLNGHTLTGSADTNSYAIYGMDSSTDRYTCDARGYFCLYDGNGEPVVPVTHFKTALPGSVKRYMAIREDAGYSFHRFYMGVTHMSLKPSALALGYKAVFAGDEMVRAAIGSFGIRVWAEGSEENAIAVSKEADQLVSGKALTLRIENIDPVQGGEVLLYAQPFITLGEETVYASNACGSLRSMLEAVNSKTADFLPSQLDALRKMIADYKLSEKGWDINQLTAI